MRDTVMVGEPHVDVLHDGENQCVRHRRLLLQRLPGDGAIHRARIDIDIAERLCREFRDRALARARGAVDGNN